MKTTRLKFTNQQGLELSAKLEKPVDTHPKAYVLFAHCFTCNKNLTAIRNISRSLTSEGFAVLRFDFTGLGESEGDFADTNFSSNVSDLVDAANFLKENYEAPSVLIGHSLGGAAVLLAAKHIESVKAVATVGAPSEPNHVAHQFGETISDIEAEGVAEVRVGGRPFTVKKQFLNDIRATNLKKEIASLKKALLVMHAPFDKIVGVENAAAIYGAAMHPKSFISLDGADHLLSNKADSLYVGTMIASWASRYLDLESRKALQSSHQVAVETGEKGFTTAIKMGKHFMVADEPESIGGDDFGPNPYDLLLASLGACTGMTLRMYANRKKWDVKNITVHLNHNKKHVDDCNVCEKPSARLDHIDKTIEIEGDLDEKQRQRMLEISEKCPVHRTLHSEIRINTKLGE
ncbi:MAG: alpha/beta fold hydrolase [Flavobacteriales bacterium]